MPLRNYTLRVLGAAAQVDEYEPRLRAGAKQLGSRYFTGRADAGDLLVNVVFDVADESSRRKEKGDGLLLLAGQVLPAEPPDRLVLTQEPSPPHEISAQVLEDRRRRTLVVPGALQSREDLAGWEEFLPRVQPRGLLELGTASGAFSRWLCERVDWFRTVDLRPPDRATPGFVQLDLWNRVDDVRNLISQAPRPFVLFCDNGNKPLEVETFAPALQVGDFLAVHDLGTEVFPHDIPAGFTERLTLGLTGFYERRT